MAYYIKSERNGKETIVKTNTADSAVSAIENRCDRYRWFWKLKQYDADTRGLEWAEAIVDDGVHCKFRMVAYKA